MFYSSPSYADDKWYIMSRYGECVDISKLAKEKDILDNVDSPESLVKKIKNNGGSPVVDSKLSSQGYVNVSTSYGKISLTFTKAKNCKKFIEGPK